MALYGRGETGGLLNLNSKKPQWESESEVNLRANTQEQYRISLEHTALLTMNWLSCSSGS
jgi:iron complex outermembrane receptor protein